MQMTVAGRFWPSRLIANAVLVEGHVWIRSPSWCSTPCVVAVFWAVVVFVPLIILVSTRRCWNAMTFKLNTHMEKNINHPRLLSAMELPAAHRSNVQTLSSWCRDMQGVKEMSSIFEQLLNILEFDPPWPAQTIQDTELENEPTDAWPTWEWIKGIFWAVKSQDVSDFKFHGPFKLWKKTNSVRSKGRPSTELCPRISSWTDMLKPQAFYIVWQKNARLAKCNSWHFIRVEHVYPYGKRTCTVSVVACDLASLSTTYLQELASMFPLPGFCQCSRCLCLWFLILSLNLRVECICAIFTWIPGGLDSI